MGGLRRLGKLFLISGSLLAGGGTLLYYSDALNNQWCSSFRLVRFGRAANAAFWVTVDYKWSLRNVQWKTDEYNATMKKIHLRSALLLREMCSRNGGLFIKVGQHIGAMEYLLPREYVQTFKLFHSEAPQTSLSNIREVVRAELGQPVEEVFASIDPEPLGAASLAQVHRAILREDESQQVAIKVQHPNVMDYSYTDMNTIQFLVECVHWFFPSFRFQWLADEIRRNLPTELNFCCEAYNQERFSSLFADLKFVRAPKVFWELTTPRLLTMEFCEGAKVDDKLYLQRHNILPDEVSHKLGRLYSEMIFQRGFVHCDPHPGNILVRAKPGPASSPGRSSAEIILLDHGLYTYLTDKFRLNYCQLWQALIYRDKAAIQHYCTELHAGHMYRLLACMVTARSWVKIESGLTKSTRTTAEMEDIQQDIPHYLAEITQLLDTVPRELVLILKTNDLLRGIEHTLDTPAHLRSYLTMSRSCILALGRHHASTASSWPMSLYHTLRMYWLTFAISAYEWWLQLRARESISA